MLIDQVIQAKERFLQNKEDFLSMLKSRKEKLNKRLENFDQSAPNADRIYKSIQAEQNELIQLAELIDGNTEVLETMMKWIATLERNWLKESQRSEDFQSTVQANEGYEDVLRYKMNLAIADSKGDELMKEAAKNKLLKSILK